MRIKTNQIKKKKFKVTPTIIKCKKVKTLNNIFCRKIKLLIFNYNY